MSIATTPSVVKDIVDSAEEREFWTVVKEHERPPFFFLDEGVGNRLNRAARVVTDGRITPNSDGSYTVEGSEHRTYRCAESCSCPQSQKGKSKWCYHMVSVALYVEWQRRLRPVAPVELGTLRAGTLPLPPAQDADADTLGNGFPIDDETLPLPLPPVTVDERLAHAPTLADRQRNYTQASLPPTAEDNDPQYLTPHTPQEVRMPADDPYIPGPDEHVTTAVLDAPEPTPAPRPLPGPVLLPSLDARTLERSMQAWAEQRQVVKRFLQTQLQEGTDYYSLKIGGRETKPTLSKAGSEKFLGLFQLHATFTQDDATWTMLGKPEGTLCYVCHLLTRSGEMVGEGRGARRVSQDNGDINKAVKMAQKCLGGTTPVLIRSKYGITRTLLNKLHGRDYSDLWIAGPGGTWRKLLRVDAQPIGPIRRLLFRDGLQVTASLDHRWPLHDGTLVDTSQLRVGDCLQRSVLPTGTSQADPDFPWLAGLFVAEGSVFDERTIRFHLHAKEDTLSARLGHIAERLGAYCAIQSQGNTQTITLYGPAPTGVVEQFVQGRLSYGKHFTGYLFRQDTKGLLSALSGYLDGDGSYTERSGRQPFWRLGFTRKNHQLAHDLRALCAMIGYRCHLGLGSSAIRKVGKVFDTYTGWIKTEEPRYNGRDLGTIVDIGEGAEVTYEVEVDGDHLFCLANGLVTHNSATIDAVLRTGALSEAFTQDINDDDDQPLQEETPATPSSADLRKRIWQLVQARAPEVKSREAIETYIQEHTGLELHPNHYKVIVERLEQGR